MNADLGIVGALLATVLALALIRQPRARAHNLRRNRAFRVAVALVGPAPVCAETQLRSFRKRAFWPASVDFFGAVPGTWSMAMLERSRHQVAMLIPWDIDLLPDWDRELSAEGVSSFHVPTALRCEQRRAVAGPLPQLIFPSQGLGVHIPDFRCLAAEPARVASLVPKWFASLFFGALAPGAAQMPKAVASDPLTLKQRGVGSRMTERDRTTLMARGLEDALNDDIWRMSQQRPPPYVRLSSTP